MDSVLATMDPEKVRAWLRACASASTPPPPPLASSLFLTRWPVACRALFADVCVRVQIAAVMDKFEKQFESLDVRSAYMDTTMAESTSTSIPEDEVNTLVMQVAETNNLDLS
ncbi:hypothetical protein EON67_01910, partial [archaeon]